MAKSGKSGKHLEALRALETDLQAMLLESKKAMATGDVDAARRSISLTGDIKNVQRLIKRFDGGSYDR